MFSDRVDSIHFFFFSFKFQSENILGNKLFDLRVDVRFFLRRSSLLIYNAQNRMEHMLCKTIESAMLEKMMNHGILRCIVQLKSQKKKLWFRRREKSVSNNRNVSNVIDKVRTLHTYMIGTRHASLFERIRYANLLSLVFIHSSQKWLSALTDSKRHYSFSILQEKKMLKINSKCSVHVQ